MDGLWEQFCRRLGLLNSVKKGFPFMRADLSTESAFVGDLGHQSHQKRTFFEVGVGQPLVVLSSHYFAAANTLIHVHARESHTEKLQNLYGREASAWSVWVTELQDV